MVATDTMSIDELLGKIMEDFRRDMKATQPPAPLRGKALVHSIVDRLVSNQVDLAEVSLWDMKRLISDAAEARRAQGDRETRTVS